MRYELYYWSGIQGRGEFVRLALEEAGADYLDRAREPDGDAAMLRLLDGAAVERPPFAPPFLKAGRLPHWPDREYPPLSRRASRPGARDRCRPALDTSAAAHDRRPRPRDPRHSPSYRQQPLLRGAAQGGKAPRRRFSR